MNKLKLKTPLSSTDSYLHNKFYDSIEEILCPVEFVRKNNSNIQYSNVASVFDIEASSFYNDEGQKRCCMYAWVFGINGKCIRGRTWREFFEVLLKVIDYYNIDFVNRFIIYIHNLSYEFQFIREYFDWVKVFSVDSRTPIYAVCKEGIEFRCSYLLSGYSLAKLGDNLHKYKVKKLVGDLDYDLIRTSITPLTDKEWGYILNDGLVVMAYIQELLENEGNITKLPITKTGFIRNLCKENCFKDGGFDYRQLIKSLTLDVDTYMQLKRAFAGGFTHANVNYVNKVMTNVSSYDFTSSYPSVMVSEMFPMSKAISYKIKSQSDFEHKINTYNCLFDIELTNVVSTIKYENYISYSKCNNVEDCLLNNGRIIQAKKLQITVTEVDYKLIRKMYKWSHIKIGNFRYFYSCYLPKEIVMTILELYQKKTTLKNVEGMEYEYQVSKENLNSCYGMCVTDICRDENVYENNVGWTTVKADVSREINKYNSSYSRTLYYAWGVWITAYARRNLFTGIGEFKDDYIYSDTDSIKCINTEKHINYIKKYNELVTKKINACLDHYGIDKKLACPKTKEGKIKPMGVWDFEGTYNKFKTLGAKRYIYEIDNDIFITIAGVSKKTGKEYLKYKYKTIDNIFKHFQEELLFPAVYSNNGIKKYGSGKSTHTYLDFEMEEEVKDYLGNKYTIREKSGLHLEAAEYSLSLSAEFKRLLEGAMANYIKL